MYVLGNVRSYSLGDTAPAASPPFVAEDTPDTSRALFILIALAVALYLIDKSED